MRATEAYKIAMSKHANRKENTLFKKCIKARTMLESEQSTDAHTPEIISDYLPALHSTSSPHPPPPGPEELGPRSSLLLLP